MLYCWCRIWLKSAAVYTSYKMCTPVYFSPGNTVDRLKAISVKVKNGSATICTLSTQRCQCLPQATQTSTRIWACKLQSFVVNYGSICYSQFLIACANNQTLAYKWCNEIRCYSEARASVLSCCCCCCCCCWHRCLLRISDAASV